MKGINEYLNDLKEKTGSDYKSAKLLGVNQAVVSTMRKRGSISDETAIKIAELLEIDAGEILLAAAMARSNESVKSEWGKLARRLGITAGLIFAVGSVVNPINDVRLNSNKFDYSILC